LASRNFGSSRLLADRVPASRTKRAPFAEIDGAVSEASNQKVRERR